MATPQQTNAMVLAKWSDRFLAWLIDFIIVNVVLGAIFAAAFPFWLDTNPDRWFRMAWDGPVRYAVTSLVFFAYWIYFESTRGQSLGKMALHIKTTNLAGKTADARSIAIQSFGKAFLLPIDVILGWLFTNEKRQRIFNRASDTIVIKVKNNEEQNPQDIHYRKE